MPHNYKSLRTHIASVHPIILKDFEAGWNRLGRRIQMKWQEGGIYVPRGGHDTKTDHFESWTCVLDSELTANAPLSQLLNEFSNWLVTTQEQEGSFYKVPELSGFILRPLRTSGIKYNVGRAAATAMLSREVERMIERLKGEIEVNGLDFIRQYFPDLFPVEEMKEIEEYMAGHN
jgi:hypothetical protein